MHYLQWRPFSVSNTLVSIQQQQRAGNTDDNDGSYLGSLRKELLEQDQRKKSKTERAKDLCETLGRTIIF